MASFSQRLNASENDGDKGGSTWSYGGANTWIGQSTDNWDAAFRFTNVTIGGNSTITDARITLRTDGLSPETGDVALKIDIYGIDEDNTADLSSDPMGRTKTTAKKNWDFTVSYLGNINYTTVDLTIIVQEIIDRAGWSSGNAMGFTFLDDTSAGAGSFYSKDGNSTKCALLEITYTPGSSPSPSLSPSISPSFSPSLSPSISPSVSISPSRSASVSPSPSSAYVMKISKPGKDISSTSMDDFYLHSSYPLLKIHSYGTFTTLNDGTLTVTHNLGYKPFVLVFSQYVNWVDPDIVLTNEFYQHDWEQVGATITFYGYTKIYSDRIDIVVGNTNFTTIAGGIDGFYYIFKDEV